MITMNVGQVILGRAWLFDKNVTIYGRSNMCQFEHEGKKIKPLPLRPDWTAPANVQFDFVANSTNSTFHCYCFFSIAH